MKKSILFILPFLLLVSCKDNPATDSFNSEETPAPNESVDELTQAKNALTLKEHAPFVFKDNLIINKGSESLYTAVERKEFSLTNKIRRESGSIKRAGSLDDSLPSISETYDIYYTETETYTKEANGSFSKKTGQNNVVTLGKVEFDFKLSSGYEVSKDGYEYVLSGSVSKDKSSEFLASKENVDSEVSVKAVLSSSYELTSVILSYTKNGLSVLNMIEYEYTEPSLSVDQL